MTRELLITCVNKEAVLLYFSEEMESSSTEVIHKWEKCVFAMFSLEGRVLVSTVDKKIGEYELTQVKQKIEVNERWKKSFDEIGIDKSVDNVISLFQYNSSTLFVTGISSQNSRIVFFTYPFLIKSLRVVNNEGSLNYSSDITS